MKRTRPSLIITLLLLGLALLLAARWVPVLQAAPTDVTAVTDAWQKAQQIAAYSYTSDIVQTTRPLPTLANVGRSTQQDHLYLEGDINTATEDMHMKLWSGSGSTAMGQGAIEIKVGNGQALGRVDQGAWQEVDDISSLFAPGQDPLGFLNAATNIRELDSETRPLPNSQPLHFTRYSYDIDGAAFAQFMQQQTETQLREQGKLPPSLSLDVNSYYKEMAGTGEIWLDEQGLPLRQIIHVTFSPQDNEQVEAHITTDFMDWHDAALTTANGFHTFTAKTIIALQQTDWQTIFINTGLTLIVLTFVALILFQPHSRKLYRVIALSMIVSMLVAPLLRGQQVYAFQADAQAQRAEQEKQQTEREQTAAWQNQLHQTNFDPHVDPLKAAPQGVASLQATNVFSSTLEEVALYDDGSDDDGDGVTNEMEILLELVPFKADSDGDGLDDGIEIWQLNTDPTAEFGYDTDGDGLSDGAEVRGFTDVNNQTWYLDPNSSDTSKDGVVDGASCSVDDNDNLICPDTDNDGEPDVFDWDDDNDGVPDTVDTSLTTVVGDLNTGLTDQTFQFDMAQYTLNEPLFVDFQLRPLNPDHLWYSMNVLDWPGNDREGQIQRIFDTTFADDPNDNQQDTRSANGDMRLVPMLEIEIPFENGRYGNLPTLDSAPAITATAPITTWLDTQEMNSLGISVRYKDEAGTILAYVPLSLVREETNGAPQAFTGRMMYRPELADFGAAHDVRLIWLVQVKTDVCSPMPDDFMNPPVNPLPESIRQEIWCADSNNWVEEGTQIVHSYYDDWVMTGLSVREDLGLKTNIVFQDPAYTANMPNYTPDGFHDDNLWTLARGLERTFLVGSGDAGFQRTMPIELFADRFDKERNQGITVPGDLRWNIDQDAFYVKAFSFEHQGYLATIPMTHTKEILNTYFTPQADTGITDPTLLFMREENFRGLDLEFSDNVTINDNSVSFNLDPVDVPDIVLASVNWAPFQYQGNAEWTAYPAEDYWNDKGADLEAALSQFEAQFGSLEADVFLARLYYFTLYSGISSLVEFDHISPPTVEFTDAELIDYLYAGTSTAVAQSAANALFNLEDFSSSFEVKLAKFLKNKLNVTSSAINMKNVNDALTYASADISHLISPDVDGNVDPSLVKANQRSVLDEVYLTFKDGGRVAQGNALLATLATVGQIALAFTDNNSIAWPILLASIDIVTNSISVTGAVATTLKIFNSLNRAPRADQISFMKFLGQRIQKLQLGMASLAFLITVAVTLGLFIYRVTSAGIQFGSLAFNAVAAEFVATLIAAIIMIAIAAIPVIGEIIAAVISIIDSLIYIICIGTGANQSDSVVVRDYICGGISGTLAKAVEFLIYDQTPLVDLQNTDRLNLTNFDFEMIDAGKGFAVGNGLNVQLDADTALYKGTSDSLLSASYRWQFSDENIQESTFAYQILPRQDKIDEPLNLGDMRDDWQTPAADGWASDSLFVHRTPLTGNGLVTFDQAGLNQSMSNFYLAEGYAVYAQECFSVPNPVPPFTPPLIPVCHLREQKDTIHLNLGENIVFDIFPETFDEFYTLAAAGNGAYKLAWGAFPALIDADGDGLRSAAVGGNDPNDSLPDTDGDGLSDYHEIWIGTSPTNADIDGDGLNDYEERRYGTNPYQADSDYDGLTDQEELDGWGFVYDTDADNNPLTTWVTANPLSPNPDGDAYPDALEKIYGFHPHIPSSSDPLVMSSQLDSGLYVAPGEVIQYGVTITNQLSNRYLLGLLDAQFPAALQNNDLDPQSFTIVPNSSMVMDGQITVNPLAASQAVSLTNRAGVVITDLAAEIKGRTLWLHLNENSNDHTDASLNGHDAICSAPSNCPTSGQAGYQGQAIDFDGTGDFLSVSATSKDLGFARDNYTVMAWVNGRDLSGKRPLLSSATAPFFAIGFNNGQPTIEFAGQPALVAPITLNQDRWYRVVWRYDKRSNEHTIFVDGQQQIGRTDLNYPYDTLAGNAMYLGQENTPAGWSSFNGLIDEVEIYPYNLTDEEILSEGRNGLLFYYAFENTNITSNGQPVPFTDDSLYQNNMAVAVDNTLLAPLTGQSGFVNQAYQFGAGDGFSDVLAVAAKPNLNLSRGTGQFSISAWIQKQQDADGWIMGNYDLSTAVDTGYPALRVNGGLITTQFGTSPNTCQLEVDAHTILQAAHADALWHHVVAAFDGQTLSIYLNNQLIGSRSDCAGVKPGDVDHFFIGGRDDVQDGQGFQGNLDELRIYAHSLTEKEIADLFWDTMPTLDMRLDEAPARTSFTDRSLSAFSGSCSGDNCPVSGVPGRANQAVLFDGVNDQIALPTADTLNLTNNSFTVSAWVYGRNLTGQTRPILGTTDTGGDDRSYLGLENGRPTFTLGNTTVSANSPLDPNRWYHIAWVYEYDDNPAQHIQTIFVDGTAVASDTVSPPAPLQGNNPLYLGRYGSDYFDGTIDQLAIHRQALTSAQIQDLMAQAPIVNLHLDEARDATSFANTADPIYDAACSGSNCPAAATKGRMYDALTFDGQNDQITIAHDDALNSEQFAVGLWIRPEQMKTAVQPIISKDNIEVPSVGRTFGLYIQPDSMMLSYDMDFCSPAPQSLSGNAGLLYQDIWNHVMMVYDGKTVSIYINGALTAQEAGEGTACHNHGDIFLGYDDHPVYPFYTHFAGQMDEAVIYPSALSTQDVRELYTYQASWYDTSYSHDVRIDADNPTVALDVSAPYLSSAEQILAIHASDPTSGIASVEYRINTDYFQDAVQDENVWLFPFTAWNNGANDICVRATDLVGHQTMSCTTVVADGRSSYPTNVNVDGAAVVPVQRDNSGESWDVTISGDIIDFYSPVDQVTVRLYDENGEPVNEWLDAAIGASNFTIDYPFDMRPNGVYTVSIHTVDGVGNTRQREYIANIDGTPPVAGVTNEPLGIIAAGTVLTGTAVESDTIQSSVSQVEISYQPADLNERSSVRYLPAGNVLHLPFDENLEDASSNPTSLFVDMSGLGNHANCAAAQCPTAGQAGQSGNALLFDGVDDVVTVPALNAALNGEITFGAWVKLQTAVSPQTILQFNNAHSLRYDATQQRFLYHDSTIGDKASANTFAPDQWVHLLVTIDADNNGRLFVNGVEEAAFNTAVRPQNGGQLLIGSSANGLIDDVFIYAQAFTAELVKQHVRGFAPVLHLPLDEAMFLDGNPVTDLSPYQQEVVYQGSTQYSEPGIVSAGALSFDTGRYLDVSTHPALDLSDGQYTQMAWVYPLDAKSFPIINGYDNNDPAKSYPSLDQTKELGLEISFGDGASFLSYETAELLTRNEWNFVAVTFDGDLLLIYVNGDLREATDAFAGKRPYPTTTFQIGRTVSQSTEYFAGMMDDIAIYRQALPAQMIANLYHQGWTATTIDGDAAAANWQHTVPDGLDGAYAVHLRTTDSNGNVSFGDQGSTGWDGYISATGLVQVSTPSAILEGDTAVLSGNILNMAPATGMTMTVAWGDGTEDVYLYDASDLSFTASHLYADDDPTSTAADTYPVTMTVQYDNGRQGTLTSAITVQNAAPEVEVGEDKTGVVDTAVSFTGIFTDAGILDTHTILWEFGDGQTADTLTPSHTYTATGTYTATLTVTDDDGGVAANSLTVKIGSGTIYLPIIMNNHVTAPDLVVQDIAVTADNVSITILNQGTAPSSEDFWVDLYIDPDPAPTAVNQTWQTLSTQGLVWGITNVTLAANETIVIDLNSASFDAANSAFNGTFTPGMEVYVQVDSAHAGTSYGAVRESHEINGGAYNNISHVSVTTVSASTVQP